MTTDDIHKCGWAHQDPVTCVQHHSETKVGSLGEVYRGMRLVAEVERRRERDFGSEMSGVLLPVPSYRHKSLCSVAKEDSIKESRKEKHLTQTNEKKLEPVPLPPPTILQTQGQSSLCSSRTSCSMSAPLTPRGTDQPSPPLRLSLFPKHLPPTIHFPLHDENCELIGCCMIMHDTLITKNCLSLVKKDVPLPKSKRALLKWKMSSITPNVVKNCVARAGFSKWSSKQTICSFHAHLVSTCITRIR